MFVLKKTSFAESRNSFADVPHGDMASSVRNTDIVSACHLMKQMLVLSTVHSTSRLASSAVLKSAAALSG